MKKITNTLLCMLFVSLGIFAQKNETEKISDTTYLDDNKDIKTRKTLTGNWGGKKKDLSNFGIHVKSTLTNFYQGMVSGEGNNDFEFGSKFTFTTAFNGEKLGLWEGFFVIARMEYNMGHSVNNRGGTALPVNTALAYPGIEGADRWDMNIYLIQFLSKTDKIVLGKINNIDLSNFSSFAGGLGIRNFYNNALASPPNAISVPYVFGAYYMSSNEKRDFTFAFYDSNSRVNKLGFNDLFTDGVTFFGSFDLITNFFGKKGKQGILGVASTKDVPNFNDLDQFFPPAGNFIESKSNRWSIAYFFEQTLYQSEDVKSHKYGVFGQFGITDGKGSFAKSYITLGIGGGSFLKSRHYDKWGIGFSYLPFSDGLSDFKIPAIPDTQFPGLQISDSETTFETFYDFYFTQWLSLGVDFQWIGSGVESFNGNTNDNVFFLGFRNRIKF